ncbi:MAG: class D beta-lactamase [Hyphomicrobium sp.]|jgi:beta-lactamase class D|nr:class D beta-lactamase [Hyphomicrobium sp.]
MPMQFAVDRRSFLKSSTAFTISCSLPYGAAADATEKASLEAEFLQRSSVGTFVRLDLTTDRLTLVNPPRAQKRYSPASTFKIANSLIAIETGTVEGPGEIIPWDGKPALMKEWERDMTLADAIRVSNVPAYQAIARRIGLKAYEDWLERLGYGNANPGRIVDRFWLDGTLTISAIEQTSFLAALALEELPMSKPTQAAVKGMLLQEERHGRRLYAKTGWQRSASPQIGWWVGWVEGNDRIDTFALNVDLASESELGKRQEIGRAILGRLGLFAG